MNTLYITKTITTLTTWENKQQNQKIEHESDSQHFYFWNDGRIAASFDESDAADILKKCDALVSAGFNEKDVQGLNYIPNNAFLSMVLTEFFYKHK